MLHIDQIKIELNNNILYADKDQVLMPNAISATFQFFIREKFVEILVESIIMTIFR